MSVPLANTTVGDDVVSTQGETGSDQYITHDEYSTAVIVILSVLVFMAIMFTLCGLFMKAEAHTKSDRDTNLLNIRDVEGHFDGLGITFSPDEGSLEF